MTGMTGKVGPQVITDGYEGPVRIGYEGQMVTDGFMGRYAELMRRGKIFLASNVAAQAVSVALATTYTGLCLSNPAGSGKTLILLGGKYTLSVAQVAIASISLIGGFSAAGIVTHTTPLAAPGIQNALIGAGADAVAKVDSAATVVNPGYVMPIDHGFTAGAFAGTSPGIIDFGGMIGIIPGGWVAWGALTAVTGFGGFAWTEVPYQ